MYELARWARLCLGALCLFHLSLLQLGCVGCGADPVDADPLSEPTCSDGIANGQESGVDCGGPGCEACPDGQPCTGGADCRSGACAGGTCAPASCTDGVKNAGETDVDCGGACPGCGAGGSCGGPTDCQSGVCTGGTCQASTCTDGVKNGSETGTDCGGSCPACAEGVGCSAPGDCQSGVCTGGACQAPTCADGVKNGSETGTDCGGGSCPACANGAGCSAPGDCQSGVCLDGVCAAPTCTDGVQNAGETGVDCGGGDCPACADGSGCSAPGDCSSGVCTGGTCQTPTCTDGVQNGSETDTDCGGSCPACTDGAGCSAPGDCQSGVCVGGTCAPATCTDGVQNGSETGADCGGGCPACAAGVGCSMPTDCQSGVCTEGVCQAPTCTDSVKNGSETGADCGGGCPACADGVGCSVPGDCLSGVCLGGICAPASCTDGVQNAGETDVDCGGGCPGCGTGGSCGGPADCQSGVCAGGTCQAPTCMDGVRNGTETGTDCGGGSCPACAEGIGCSAPGDCQSGVCTGGMCQPPTCTDGVHNGTETGTDCGGGSCPVCGAGAGCSAPGDCLSGVCTGGTCQAPACTDGVQNGGEEDVDCGGSCPACDTVAPTVLGAFLPYDTVLRVRFSEAMDAATSGTGAANPAAYCVERTDGTPTECTPTGDFQLLSVQPVGGDSFDIALSAPPRPGSYTVLVTGVADLAGNPLGTPRYADFQAGPLRVMYAQSEGATTVRLVFSQVVVAGEGVPGSASCDSAQTCARRYRLVGPTALGDVVRAEVLPVPHDNEVRLTHLLPQGGGNYTLIAANGVDGDGLNDRAAGAIQAAFSGEPLGELPLDRATFAGLGLPVVHFGDGPLAVDPFADGSTFTYVFKYGGKVYLGPNRTGSRAVRMQPDGTQVEDLGFSFVQDTNNEVGTRSLNIAPAPFPGVGYLDCKNNTRQCGPDNEDGRGLFTSGLMDGQEWLVLSGSQSGGGLDYVYVTRDADATLNMQYVDLDSVVGGTAKSFSVMGVFGGRGYLGFPDTNGAKSPALVALLGTPDASLPGLDTRGNGTTGNACDPAVHSACNLAANLMPGIGVSGKPANTASVVLVDFLAEHAGLLHLGNNGGLMRATVPQPRDYASAPGDWTSIVPSHRAYAAHASLTTGKTSDFTPADRAWSAMAVFKGHVYLGRNTTAGPQLWRCDPGVVSGPAPASAEACDAGDWTLIAANGTGTRTLSQFDNTNNARLTLLVASGEHLYVGFDNAVDGVVVYRSTVDVPDTRADFAGEGCTADTAGCPGLGGNGFGEPTLNRQVNDAAALGFDGESYLYVSVSDGATSPVRIYRQRD